MSVNFDLGDVNARRAIDADCDVPLIAIVGPAASGKTETLARRYVALLARDPAVTTGATIVTASHAGSAAVLAARIAALSPASRPAQPAARYVGCSLDRLAFDLLAEHATLTGLAYDIEPIDTYDAQEIFERAIAPLFALDWSEFLGPDIDPEIPGLRAPDRFAGAVLELIRKLRDAQIGPDAFLRTALRGATDFYAKPPNLSAPGLLFATKDEHRGALTVDAAERERQRRREIDLAKIVAKIYRSYVDQLVTYGCLTGADAIAEGIRLLTEQPAVARACRRRFAFAIVDDVHDLPTGEFRLLQAIFGANLTGVTVAGDPDAATRTFAGARPERIFAAAATTLRLQANYRVPLQIAASIRALLGSPDAPPIPAGDALRLHRAIDQNEEAAFLTASVAECLAGGCPPGRIAVVHRSLRNLALYEDALVDHNIPVALRGDAALFERHDTLDALAILHSVIDPFRHAWLLRALQLPSIGLSDASLALLCGEPASTQALLFDLPPQEDGDGSRRWDRRRDLRLGTNVVRGDRDIDLTPEARERLVAFRSRRAEWQHIARSGDVAGAAAAILADAGLGRHRPGETVARTRRRATLVGTLLDAISRYAGRHRGSGLEGALAYCERIARGNRGPLVWEGAGDAVVVASIEHVREQRFDHVFIVDVRAGSFPPYYVPDAFLFSPVHGMIPKDNVGEAVTARTVKFTWYSYQAKLRENYGREDRRALTVALARADITATVSASGRATRAIAAPELLVELQALRPQPRIVERPAARAPSGPGTHASDDANVAEERPEEVPMVAAERVAAMMRCVVCAPRRVIGQAIDTGFTLLSGQSVHADRTIDQRNARFSFLLGPAVVYGTVAAVIVHEGRRYVALTRHDRGSAALAVTGLHGRVSADAYFVETADDVFDGPHGLDVEDQLAAARGVLDGSRRPYCAEHRNA